MNPVMCVTKAKYNLVEGINKLTLQDEDIHFIQREIVDSKLPNFHAIGTMLIQVLPYIYIKCGNEYLTYARRGSESRLHGKRSMGFGGHVELADLDDFINGTIHNTAEREIKEELGLETSIKITDDFIYSNYDHVSQVHLGVIGVVELSDKSLIKPDNSEVIDPLWQTADDIRGRLDGYERWSQILIKHLDKLGE